MVFFTLILGLTLLFVGGEILVKSSVVLAKRIGLSPLVIGLTVVAFGTSSPELLVSSMAALEGHSALALGNVLGSNISNILLVLGISALICPIAIAKRLSGLDGTYMLAATICLAGFCYLGAVLTLIDGLLLFGALLFYIIWAIKHPADHSPTEEETTSTLSLSWVMAIFFIACGIGLLVFGADLLVDSAITIALTFGISEHVIGLTIVAIGSSAPELAASIMAALRKHTDIAIGNIIGSNIFNLLGIMGVTSIITPVSVSVNFMRYDIPLLLLVTLILYVIIRLRPSLGRVTGGLFFVSYIGYISALYTLN